MTNTHCVKAKHVVQFNYMDNFGFNDLRASDKQRKLYFILMKKRGFTSDQAKEILKKRFDLEHFSDIDKERMSYVIDKLLSSEK